MVVVPDLLAEAERATWRRRPIHLRLLHQAIPIDEVVPGYVHECGLGIHRSRTERGRWTVTHLASGLRVTGGLRTLREAKAAVTILTRLGCPWHEPPERLWAWAGPVREVVAWIRDGRWDQAWAHVRYNRTPGSGEGPGPACRQGR